jgi:hypothetical protein
VNLPELTTAFLARGFDYMSTGEAELLINDAYLVDIATVENWPFLEAQRETTAPVTIENLETIELVVDMTQGVKLHPLDLRNLTDDYPLRQETGTPSFYYVAEGVMNVYPVNTTDTLLVRYRAAPTALTGNATPIIPTRFHSLIIDGAVARAYEGSDDYELAQSAATTFQSRLQRMREVLLEQYRDGPHQFVQLTNTDLSYWR